MKREQENHIFIALCITASVFIQLFTLLTLHESLDHLFDKSPVFKSDYAGYTYYTERAMAFARSSGSLWGYDPFYHAGFPLSFVWNSGTPLQVAGVLLEPFLSPVQVVKIYYIMNLLFFPLIIFLSARNFGLPSKFAAAATLFATITSIMGVHNLLHIVGMLPAYTISFFSLFIISFLFKTCEKKRLSIKDFAGATLLLFSAMLIHKTSAIILAAPMLAMFLLYDLQRKRFLIIVTGIAALLNSFWIIPMIKFLPLKEFIDANQDWTNESTFNQVFNPGLHINTLFVFLIRLIIATASIWALLKLWKQHRKLAVMLLAFSGTIAALTYLGQFNYFLRMLNPYRYIAVLYLLLSITAAFSLFFWLKRNWHQYLVTFMLCCFLLAPSYNDISYQWKNSNHLPPYLNQLVSDLRNKTDQNHRVLFELHGYHHSRQNDPYLGSGLGFLISRLTGRAFAGGPYPYNHLQHNRVNFVSGRFNNLYIKKDTELALVEKLLKRYNTRWIICFSHGAVDFFQKHNNLFTLKNVYGNSQIFFFEYLRPSSYFIQGSGKVEFDFNTLKISNNNPGTDIAISFHAFSSFEASPKIRLETFRPAGSPLDFILIRNAPAEILLRKKSGLLSF